ncbi:MAG: hypothetical protein JW753_03195 [Dehalococcoidia bacterium]|nr:hypothetical protein [Dehalococcoidia bacterium]
MALPISEEVKTLMYSTWLPALMSTVLETTKWFPAEHRDRLLQRMCRTCEDMAMGGAVGIRPGMTWEEYLRFLQELPAPMGPWTVKRTDDVYDLEYGCSIGEDGKPRCHCPLVQLGITEPLPQCCDGGASLAGRMMEAATGRPVAEAEVVGSPLRNGASVCHYRVHLKQ